MFAGLKRDEGDEHAKGFDTYTGFKSMFLAIEGGGSLIQERADGTVSVWIEDWAKGGIGGDIWVTQSGGCVAISSKRVGRYRTVNVLSDTEYITTRVSHQTVDALPDSEDVTGQ